MHKRTGFVLAVSMTVVLITLGNRPASAQGSATIPTGGGKAYQVPGTGEGIPDYRKPIDVWAPTSFGFGSFIPRPWITRSQDRSTAPTAARRYWWGTKVSR